MEASISLTTTSMLRRFVFRYKYIYTIVCYFLLNFVMPSVSNSPVQWRIQDGGGGVAAPPYWPDAS